MFLNTRVTFYVTVYTLVEKVGTKSSDPYLLFSQFCQSFEISLKGRWELQLYKWRVIRYRGCSLEVLGSYMFTPNIFIANAFAYKIFKNQWNKTLFRLSACSPVFQDVEIFIYYLLMKLNNWIKRVHYSLYSSFLWT